MDIHDVWPEGQKSVVSASESGLFVFLATPMTWVVSGTPWPAHSITNDHILHYFSI